MTETLALIDGFLTDTAHQSLIDGDRVRDLLLDLRSSLLVPAAAADIEGEPYEDTYLPGIADYDRFGRASWDVPE
jgi:hypothetical protein